MVNLNDVLMYKEGDRVSFDIGIQGTGTICGVATNGAPVIGRGYIVKLDKIPSDYQYSCVVIFEQYLERLEPSESNQEIHEEIYCEIPEKNLNTREVKTSNGSSVKIEV